MVPASTFIYGSILIDVTFNPVIFNRRPVDEAICGCFKIRVAKIVYWAHTNDPLSDTTDDTTGNNDILCHSGSVEESG